MSFASRVSAVDAACVREFGVAITYRHESGTEDSVSAIFEPTREPEASSTGVYAVVFLRVASLSSAPARGDAVIYGSTTYSVYDVEVDVAGGAVLRLRAA